MKSKIITAVTFFVLVFATIYLALLAFPVKAQEPETMVGGVVIMMHGVRADGGEGFNYQAMPGFPDCPEQDVLDAIKEQQLEQFEGLIVDVNIYCLKIDQDFNVGELH